MAGHSKWANIKFKKAAQDNKRGKIFTKLIRAITVAARDGGADLASNPHLALAIDKAKQSNVKKESIKKAIESGVGGLSGELIFSRYDGYAPGGVAVMVDCLTDNKNRTVAEVRHAFSKHGGSMGADGSVSYLFAHKGFIHLEATADEEEVLEIALNAGADDVLALAQDSFEIVCEIDCYRELKEALEAKFPDAVSGSTTWSTDVSVELGLDDAQQLNKIVDMLEDLDDVQNVYTNASIPDDILAELD